MGKKNKLFEFLVEILSITQKLKKNTKFSNTNASKMFEF